MTENDIKLFSIPKNKKVIGKLHETLETFTLKEQKFEPVLQDLTYLISDIFNKTDFYDTHCQSSIVWIGESAINEVNIFIADYSQAKLSGQNNQDIRNLYVTFYRFLIEANFSVNEGVSIQLTRIIKNIDSFFYLFEDHQRQQLTYARYFMVADIVKKIINHPNIVEIKSFNDKYSGIEKIKSGWDAEIIAKETAVNTIKDKLEQYKIAFNFVGLYQGFDNLASKKNTERNWALVFLTILAILSITPVAVEIYLILFKGKDIIMHKDLILYAIFPTLTLQLILIYFFKIALVNYKSINAQLLQIDLRKTLCQFIQNYTVYAKEMKTSDASSLEKFENLIFSGLITNEENLPSTFDGFEQIGKIAQSIKGS